MNEITIFIASSLALEAERDKFHLFIGRMNESWRKRGVFFKVVRCEYFLDSVSAEGLQSEYNKAIESCDIFVMLVHNKVGMYTAEEFEQAFGRFLENKKPRIFTYFKDSIHPGSTKDQRSLLEFRERLEELGHYETYYSSSDNLENQFRDQLEELAEIGFIEARPTSAEAEAPKGLMEKYRRPLQMPPMPEHFVERPEPQAAVKQQLLSENDKGGTLVVSAIHGLGGIGKSVLATKLAHEPDVQDFFDDGILWVTLGQRPDILPLLSDWIQALGDYDYKPTAVASASSHLRTLLYDKCVLLVVDDVWNPEHLEPFRVGGEKSRVLVTTREARIEGAQLHSLDVMDKGQALELMAQRIAEPLGEKARERALAFAKRVGYLPLALELAASQIDDGVSWRELLEDFEQEVGRLELLDVYERSEMPDDEKRRKYSLLACFNLSLKQLSDEELRQFAWLGVVPEDVSLTREMAETLWGVSRRQAGAVLRKLRAKSLVLQGVSQPFGDGADERASYRMHDLMHDLAQELLQKPEVPEKDDGLAGLGLSVAQAHGELLERYEARAQRDGEGRVLWHTLTDDGYIFAHLTWHMEQAQQPERVHALLAASNAEGRNGWYAACDALGQPAGFVNDVGRAWKLAVEGYEDAPGETVALLYRYALVRGSLNSLASNVPAEMVGGLVKEGYWSAAQGLAYAQQAQDPWQRAECIAVLVPYILETQLQEVLKTVNQIKDATYRSYVLSQLATRFNQVWPDALTAIQNIQDRFGNHRFSARGFSYRALAIENIIEQLPSQYIRAAIDIANSIHNIKDKTNSLINIARREESLWNKALSLVGDIEDESSRAWAFIEMAEHLPELWPEALAATRSIENESSRAWAFIEMAEHLPELWPEALAAIRSIEIEPGRVRGLCLAAEQRPELWPEVLEAVSGIKRESIQVICVNTIVHHIPEDYCSEMLGIVREMKDESPLSHTLCSLARHIPDLWPEALEMTYKVRDESVQAKAVSCLAIDSPELWPTALAIASRIRNKTSHSRTLCSLAQSLPELWPEALESACKIINENSQSRILCSCIEKMPQDLLPELLATAHKIEDDSSRLRVLGSLIGYFPGLWPEVLDGLRKVKKDFLRLYVLQDIAPYLLPDMWHAAMSLIHKTESKGVQLSTIAAICKYLPPKLQEQVLDIVYELEGEDSYAITIIEIAKHLPKIWPETLVATSNTKHESSRALAFVGVSKYMKDQWPEALNAVCEIKDENSRVHVMKEMAEALPVFLWTELLEIVRRIKDEESRALAISGLIDRLPKEQQHESLKIVHTIQDNYYRAGAIQKFIFVLEESCISFLDWADMLDTLAYQNRSALLEALPDSRETLIRLGDDTTIERCLQAMREVCAQWP